MGSAVHHRIEKPCQTIRERPSLNEKITAMTTGRMDQSRYAIVMPCRTRGFRHGFLKYPPGAVWSEPTPTSCSRATLRGAPGLAKVVHHREQHDDG